jgi:V/A-type H+-transporting ATPase subunit E
VGYPELLRVLEEEAAREAREVRLAAEREGARVRAEARAAADAARASLLLRERGEGEARRRAAADALVLARERALLLERRRLLAELRAAVEARLPEAGGPDLDARLLVELSPELGDGAFEVIVDPGAEESARAALARIDPAAAHRATVSASPVRRGGVEVRAGRRVLDDTLPSRLARAWPVLETELCALLLEEA